MTLFSALLWSLEDRWTHSERSRRKPARRANPFTGWPAETRDGF